MKNSGIALLTLGLMSSVCVVYTQYRMMIGEAGLGAALLVAMLIAIGLLLPGIILMTLDIIRTPMK